MAPRHKTTGAGAKVLEGAWRPETGLLMAGTRETLCHYVTEMDAYASRFLQTHWLGECVYRIGDRSAVQGAGLVQWGRDQRREPG